MNLTRRTLLIAGASSCAAVAAGGLWLATRDSPREWIEATLRNLLPNIDLDATSLAAFVTHEQEQPEFASRKIALALSLDALAPAMLRIAPEASDKIAELERVVVSDYLLGSNFFRVQDPRGETIYWSGDGVCGNPFAVFRPD